MSKLMSRQKPNGVSAALFGTVHCRIRTLQKGIERVVVVHEHGQTNTGSASVFNQGDLAIFGDLHPVGFSQPCANLFCNSLGVNGRFRFIGTQIRGRLDL